MLVGHALQTPFAVPVKNYFTTAFCYVASTESLMRFFKVRYFQLLLVQYPLQVHELPHVLF